MIHQAKMLREALKKAKVTKSWTGKSGTGKLPNVRTTRRSIGYSKTAGKHLYEYGYAWATGDFLTDEQIKILEAEGCKVSNHTDLKYGFSYIKF